MNVRIFCGAAAYAMIEHEGGRTDIRLSPGKGAPASLREYAAEQRAKAARIVALADLAEQAADCLESPAPSYLQAGERLWNGAIVSHCLAVAHNRLSDRIAAFEREGRKVPESLWNARHKLIRDAI